MTAKFLMALLFSAVSGYGLASSEPPFSFSYNGRLSNNSGTPLAGPVDLEVRFFHSFDSLDPIDLIRITKSS